MMVAAMTLRIKTFAVTAAMTLLLSNAALAGMVVKQVDANGRITYTDNPDPKHVILAQYTERGSASIEQPGGAFNAANANLPPPVIIGEEPSMAPLTEVERALRSFTRLSTPLALMVDSSEAARRLRQQSSVARNGSALPLVFTKAEPDTRTGTGTPPGLAARIFSPLFYLFVSLGVGFMAYMASRIFLNGIVPLCREMWPGMPSAVQNWIHGLTLQFDQWRDSLSTGMLRQ
jgi:hypothetical protein